MRETIRDSLLAVGSAAALAVARPWIRAVELFAAVTSWFNGREIAAVREDLTREIAAVRENLATV